MGNAARMDNCGSIIEGFRAIEIEQRNLSDAVASAAVADMHVALANFASVQAALAEEICED